MTLQAIVKNFRGVSESLIDIAPIALLCGENGAGKTSVARAIAAAATGKAVPYSNVTKKDCAVLLRHGTHAGSVSLGGEGGTASVSWPDAEMRTIGTPPQASIIAAGLTDLFSMKPDQALLYLIKALNAEPTEDDIMSALQQLELDEKVIATIVDVIKKQGWDAAHKRAVERGQNLKGAWAHIAGTSYGDKKVNEWYPEGWEDSLLQQSPESLQAAIEEAQAALEAAIGTGAVNQAETARLRALIDKLPEFADAIPLHEETLKKAKEALEETQKELQNTPNPNNKGEEMPCPHCEKPVIVTPTTVGNYALAKAEKLKAKDTKEQARKHAGLCGELSKRQGEMHAAQRALDDVKRQHEEAQAAEKKLQETPAGIAAATDAVINEARLKLNTLQAQRAMLCKYQEARATGAHIAINQKIVDLLDETGLRKNKLSQCIDAFASHYIEPICADFAMPLVSIDADLNVDLGTTAYPMLSRGEQARVRCVLQLAIAQLEKAGIIIIDDADTLVGQWRSGLMKAIYNVGIPAVVCIAMKKGDAVPDLRKMGAGATYWCENGVCKLLGEERQAA